MEETKSLLSKIELAERLGVSTQTIDRWRKVGLPFKRAGVKLIRFDFEEVTAWLENYSK
jgi:excisionase family DNA binding protein